MHGSTDIAHLLIRNFDFYVMIDPKKAKSQPQSGTPSRKTLQRQQTDQTERMMEALKSGENLERNLDKENFGRLQIVFAHDKFKKVGLVSSHEDYAGDYLEFTVTEDLLLHLTNVHGFKERQYTLTQATNTEPKRYRYHTNDSRQILQDIPILLAFIPDLLFQKYGGVELDEQQRDTRQTVCRQLQAYQSELQRVQALSAGEAEREALGLIVSTLDSLTPKRRQIEARFVVDLDDHTDFTFPWKRVVGAVLLAAATVAVAAVTTLAILGAVGVPFMAPISLPVAGFIAIAAVAGVASLTGGATSFALAASAIYSLCKRCFGGDQNSSEPVTRPLLLDNMHRQGSSYSSTGSHDPSHGHGTTSLYASAPSAVPVPNGTPVLQPLQGGSPPL